MAKKARSKKGAAKPMGAGPIDVNKRTHPLFTLPPMPRWSTTNDPKKALALLKQTAKKFVAPKDRAKFIEQGRIAIDQQAGKQKVSVKFEALMAEIKPIFDRHGVRAAQVMVKLEIDPKLLKLGVNGWAMSQKVTSQDALEMLGMMSRAGQQLGNKFER